MENFIIYMAKASGLLALFFLAYYTLLRKETFFNANRFFLLAGLVTAVVLPFVVYTKVIWIEPQEMQVITVDYLVPAQHGVVPTEETGMQINWFDVITGIYFAGVLLFIARFVLDLLSIKRLLSGNVVMRDKNFIFIDSGKVRSPFSFFNYIVYNSAVLQPEELESIISHEKIHSAQKHSLDMIISQLFCVAFWFNPFAWMYKKSVSQNLEFIADAGATKQLEDKQAYQKTLLKITIQPECVTITNHFYQSLIKKRIVMLNKQQSKKRNSWKYAAVLPALIAFMLLFQVKVVAQEKESAGAAKRTTIWITKDDKDSDLEQNAKVLKEEFDTDVTFSNVTRNTSSEITGIKVAVKDKDQSKIYEVSGTEPINSFTIVVEKGNGISKNSINFGTSDNIRLTADRILYHQGVEGDSVPGKKYSIAKPITIAEAVKAHPGNMAVSIGDKDALVIINGVKQKKGDMITLPLGENVTEVKVLNNKEAKKKYGKEAKEGAVEITTKEGNSRLMLHGPATYVYDMPDLQGMQFELSDYGIPNLDELRSYVEIYGANSSDNVKAWSDRVKLLSDEDMETAREALKKAQVQIQAIGPDVQLKVREQLKGMQSTDFNKEMDEMRKEIEKAKKEIKDAIKELEQAKKEQKKKAN